MFVVITYDVGEKRVNRVCKKLKMYLTWVQNSVFEGTITDSKLKKCLAELSLILNRQEDSLYIYKIKNPNNINKEVVGNEKNFDECFI